MGDILLLTLRRLRAPLIVLIVVYAISVLGLVCTPGPDVSGQPLHMNFFHAFYVVSYTATTIGFGELPFAFSDAQRAWITLSIYLSVTAWAYTLGSIFTLAQDTTFRAAVARSRFANRVRITEEPFYIIAGYGQSGTALAHALDDLHLRSVVVELRQDRAARADIEEYRQPPLMLATDARWPDVLRDAGVLHPKCEALVVLVGDDEVTQAIAIGAAVLNPGMQIIARVHDRVARANMAGFPNIVVIDPFETFATNLTLNLASPAVLWLEDWLSSVPGSPCPTPANTPRGHWLIFGFGRFGHAMAQALEKSGSTWTALDSDLRLADEPHLQHADNSQDSLREAGIDHAIGIIACTNRDAINLALVSRARAMKPALCVLIRQNHILDSSLILAARADLVFVKSEVMLRECLQILVSPLLNAFLLQIRAQGQKLAEEIIVRLLTELDERVPHIWVFNCLSSYPGLRAALSESAKQPLLLSELLINPVLPPEELKAVPLLLKRDGQSYFLPALTSELRSGDQILFAGRDGMESLQRRFLLDPSPIEFVRTGIEPPRSWIFRWLAEHRAARHRAGEAQ